MPLSRHACLYGWVSPGMASFGVELTYQLATFPESGSIPPRGPAVGRGFICCHSLMYSTIQACRLCQDSSSDPPYCLPRCLSSVQNDSLVLIDNHSTVCFVMFDEDGAVLPWGANRNFSALSIDPFLSEHIPICARNSSQLGKIRMGKSHRHGRLLGWIAALGPFGGYPKWCGG